MARPPKLPRWATDLSNNTEPSAGTKNTGWAPNADGISDYDNWFKETTYRWLQHLSEGVHYKDPFEWELISGTATPAAGGQRWTWTIGNAPSFVMPLDFPAGTVIEKVTFSYEVTGASPSVSMGWGRIKLSDNTIQQATVITDTTIAGAFETADLTTFGVDGGGIPNGSAGKLTLESGYAYRLYFTSPSSDGKLGGVAIYPEVLTL